MPFYRINITWNKWTKVFTPLRGTTVLRLHNDSPYDLDWADIPNPSVEREDSFSTIKANAADVPPFMPSEIYVRAKVDGEVPVLVIGYTTSKLPAEMAGVAGMMSPTSMTTGILSGLVVSTSGQVINVSGALVEISGDIVHISGQAVGISGESIRTSGQVAHISGQAVSVSGNAMNVSGNVVQVSGQGVATSVSGNVVGVSGQVVHMSGQAVVTSVSGNIVQISGQSVSTTVSGNIVHTSGQVAMFSTTPLASGSTISLGFERQTPLFSAAGGATRYALDLRCHSGWVFLSLNGPVNASGMSSYSAPVWLDTGDTYSVPQNFAGHIVGNAASGTIILHWQEVGACTRVIT